MKQTSFECTIFVVRFNSCLFSSSSNESLMKRNIVGRKFNITRDMKINSDELRYQRQRQRRKQYLLIKFVVVFVHFFRSSFKMFVFVNANETRISIKNCLESSKTNSGRTHRTHIKAGDMRLSEIVLNDDSNHSSHNDVCTKVFACELDH